MRSFLKGLGLIGLLAVAAPVRAQPGAVAQQRVPYRVVGTDTLHLHAFVPAGPGEAPRAAAVFFFGGGWVRGSPEQFFPHCRHLAARGMVCFAAEYRVRDRHGTTPFEAVEDARAAVRWIRDHAEGWHVDGRRIVAAGGSAGGHLAAGTALLRGGEAGEASVPDALVLFNPVIDTSERGYGAERLGERALELSPVHHVVPGVPPALVFHGTADTTVPFENAARFCAAMQAAGNRCELVSFEGARHGFFNEGRGDGSAYRSTLAAMDRFLVSLGFLAPEAE